MRNKTRPAVLSMVIAVLAGTASVTLLLYSFQNAWFFSTSPNRLEPSEVPPRPAVSADPDWVFQDGSGAVVTIEEAFTRNVEELRTISFGLRDQARDLTNGSDPQQAANNLSSLAADMYNSTSALEALWDIQRTRSESLQSMSATPTADQPTATPDPDTESSESDTGSSDMSVAAINSAGQIVSAALGGAGVLGAALITASVVKDRQPKEKDEKKDKGEKDEDKK